MGLIAMSASIPSVVLAPVMGALADRIDRRRALIFVDSLAALAIAVMVWLAVTDQMKIWHIYPLVALVGACGNFHWPAMSALTTELLPKSMLSRAAALTSINEATSVILSPILAALLYTRSHISVILWIDALTFALAAVCALLAWTPKREPIAGPKEGFLQNMSHGFRFIWERPAMMRVLLFFMLTNFAAAVLMVVYPAMVMTYHSKEAVGTIHAVGGLGMLAGGMAVAARGVRANRAWGMRAGGIVAGAALLFALLPPHFAIHAMVLLGVMLPMPYMYACSQSLWQTKTPVELQGRVFSVRRMAGQALAPLAYFLSGGLNDRVFEPAMRKGGALVPYFGGWMGVGPGSGARLLIALIGVAMAGIAVLILGRALNVESEVADAS